MCNEAAHRLGLDAVIDGLYGQPERGKDNGMNKRLKKLMLLLLVGMMSLSTALAEVKYGSQGDEVKQLQMKLYNMGFMDEKPDGVFGAKTQAGVKALQRYLGAEETGVADEGTLNDLGLLWNMAIGMEEEPGAPIDAAYLTLAAQVTDANSAFFDTRNNFAGCIAGVHEVLRRQGLFAGIWCLNPEETLSAGQKEEIDRVYAMYPDLNDDVFVKEFLAGEEA